MDHPMTNPIRFVVLSVMSLLLSGCASLPSAITGKTPPESKSTYAARKQAAVAEFEQQRDTAQVHAAVNAWQRGEAQKAESMLQGILQRTPNHLAARLRLAELLAAEDETAGAEEQLRACLALAPDSAEVHHSLGLLLSGWPGREEESQTHLRRACELEPDNRAYSAALDGE
jgi:Tfp pilus assembly protein PilF